MTASAPEVAAPPEREPHHRRITRIAAWIVRLAREIPGARTIKLEDPPTPFKISRILELTAREGALDVRIFGGLGGVFLLEELMAGAAGAMTGFAFPELLVAIVRHFRNGRVDEAADLFYSTVALMRFEFQESIGMAIRKEALARYALGFASSPQAAEC